jgi:uncharacterized membrane protein YebE (DUF533 family)
MRHLKKRVPAGLSPLGPTPRLPCMVSEAKTFQARSVAQTRALQVLGAGALAGLLGGVASGKLWMGVCFAAGGVLVTLSAIDYRCAALAAPQKDRENRE